MCLNITNFSKFIAYVHGYEAWQPYVRRGYILTYLFLKTATSGYCVRKE